MPNALQKSFRQLANTMYAKNAQRFFKTGKGEYGEGDLFLGIRMPEIRQFAKAHKDLPFDEIEALLLSTYHEERMLALVILTLQYPKADRTKQKEIFDFYLAHRSQINNWDLVDVTTPHIVGAYLFGKSPQILFRLAKSKSLWDRRIAILATFYFISKGQCDVSMQIAEMLVGDPHDLIHKAVGWMLREVGKRCSVEVLRKFLDRHASTMPRTMLRYAMEKLSPTERKKYLRIGE